MNKRRNKKRTIIKLSFQSCKNSLILSAIFSTKNQGILRKSFYNIQILWKGTKEKIRCVINYFSHVSMIFKSKVK